MMYRSRIECLKRRETPIVSEFARGVSYNKKSHGASLGTFFFGQPRPFSGLTLTGLVGWTRGKQGREVEA